MSEEFALMFEVVGYGAVAAMGSAVLFGVLWVFLAVGEILF